MKVVESVPAMKALARGWRRDGKRIGLVPTMGYLHEGHLSLVRESTRRTDVTIVSIFVNPTQFGPNEDFTKYPRDLAKDIVYLETGGADCLFHPAAAEVYPPDYRTFVEVQGLQDRLCGRSRPGHFRGVATVVLKLFEIVRPDLAFFGAKDAQQVLIIRRMAADLDLDLEVVTCPIVREPDDERTLCVVPTLICSTDAIEELLEALEVRFLGNRDRNLHFGLPTDFGDAAEATLPDDELLLQAARTGIEKLNARYADEDDDRFFLFHRPRRWNPAERRWMGHERKRGKLAELNLLLRGGGSGGNGKIKAGDLDLRLGKSDVRDIQVTVNEVGTIEPVVKVDVKSSLSGKVIDLLVLDGDRESSFEA